MVDSLPFVRAAAASRVGNSHERNEDAYRILDTSVTAVRRRRRGVLYAVADGVSTTDMGAFAARTVCERLERFFDEQVHPEIGWVAQQVLDADKLLRAEGKGKAATTLSVLWLVDGQAWHVHVGNSEIMRLRKGKLSWISPEPGAGSRRQLRTFVGMGNVDKELSVDRVSFAAGDVFLLFTDGVREAWPDSEGLTRHWARTQGDPQRYVASVIDEIAEKQIGDDATLIAVSVLATESMRVSLMGAR